MYVVADASGLLGKVEYPEKVRQLVRESLYFKRLFVLILLIRGLQLRKTLENILGFWGLRAF